GVGTFFTTELVVGGTFKTAGGHVYVIKSIANDTQLTLTDSSAAAAVAESGVAFSTSDFLQVVDPSTGLVKAVPGYTNNNPKYSGSGDPAEAAKNVAGNFIVMDYNGSNWVQSTGWTASALNVNDPGDTGTTNNYITLTNASGVSLTTDQQVKVLFFATGTNYITNPASGAFFVKINTYNQAYDATSPVAPDVDISGLAPATNAN